MRLVALSCLSLLALAARAAAEEPAYTLPETVVTATRTAAAPAAVPASVTVIDRARIEAEGWRTLPEALAAVPGVAVVRSGPVGASTSVFMRGTESDHVLVLLDGMPVNDPSTPTGLFNFGDELLADIERIEVVRGPGSALYGANAIGGVVNLVTSVAPGQPFSAEGEIAGGTNATASGRVRVSGSAGAIDYRLAAGGLRTDGFDATPSRFLADTGEDDGARLTALSGGLGWQLDDHSRIEGALRFRDNQFDLDDVPSDDPNSTGRNRQLTARLSGETLIAGVVTSRLDLGWNRTDRAFDNDPDTASVADVDDDFDSTRLRADWSNRFTIADGQTMVLGAEWLRDEAEIHVNEVSAFGPFIQDLDADGNNLALYGEWQGRFAEKLDLNLGLRWDRPDDFDDRVSVRAGAVWHLDNNLRLHLSAGSGFKAPSLYDRFGVDNFGYSGNPNLKPETSAGWEAGLDGTADLFARADAIGYGATWYQTEIQDLIDYDFALNTSVNRDRARIRGAELYLSLAALDSLDVRIDYGFTEAIDTSTGQPLARRPRHSGRISADWRPLDGLHIRPSLAHTGGRDDVTYDDAGGFIGTARTGGYWVAALAADYAVTDYATVFGRVDNAFDRRIEDPNGFAADGVSALAGLRVRL